MSTDQESVGMSDEETTHKKLVVLGNKRAIDFTYRFAWFWAIISSIYFFSVTFFPLPSEGKDFANIILGFLLGTAVSTIIGYFYGSSN